MPTQNVFLKGHPSTGYTGVSNTQYSGWLADKDILLALTNVRAVLSGRCSTIGLLLEIVVIIEIIEDIAGLQRRVKTEFCPWPIARKGKEVFPIYSYKLPWFKND